MKNRKKQTSRLFIAENLATLRQHCQYSQEDIAEKIGVSRQAVAKWESGETLPDLVNCQALADLYGVSVDDLLHFDQASRKLGIPPKGKHIFGIVKVGERGQIVLPKKAREVFCIQPGDMMVVLGDESPDHAGIALMHENIFLQMTQMLKSALDMEREEETGEKP